MTDRSPAPEALIRPFLLYGGLVFTIIHRAVMVGIILLFLHLFVVTVVPIRGSSMDPTLAPDIYIFVDQLSPSFRALKRGEIVAFRSPANSKEKFIKRIIGLPDEKILVEDGAVFFQQSSQGSPIRLREPYLLPQLKTGGHSSLVLGKNEYYVLGDNREVSFDSRSFGPVKGSQILGRAWLVVWPIGEIRLISHFDPTKISL